MKDKAAMQRQHTKRTNERADKYSYTSAPPLGLAPGHALPVPPTPQMPPYPLVYVGLQAIAKAVGAGHLAVRRWIREENFPARRCSDGIYRAEPEAIRQWFRTMRQ